MRFFPLTIVTAAMVSVSAAAAPFSWVNGNVTSFTAQQPKFTVAVVDNTVVRFCNSNSGKDYAVAADNLFYDMLKTALETKRKVQVGINNFGPDPQAGTDKLCINRVILTGP